MKVIPFWGCMIPLKYPQMESAVRFSMEKLGVKLVDDNRFSCCPDPIYYKAGDKLSWYTLAARNICIAEQQELDIITICSGCTSTLCDVNHHLKHDEDLRNKVNERLKTIGMKFEGTINVRHLVTVLDNDIGEEHLASTIVRPLENLSVAIHYGCHLLKPSEIMQVEDPLYPKILSRLFAVTGAVPVDHDETLLCCGKACKDVDLSFDMTNTVFKSIKESKADCLGLICPTCFDSFDIGQIRVSRKFKTKYNIPVIYFFQLLALAQGAKPEQVGLKYHKIMTDDFMEKMTAKEAVPA